MQSPAANSPESFYNLGNSLADNRQLDEAVTAYRQAIALRPDYLQAVANLGNALTRLGRYHEAIEIYERAIAINPDHPFAHFNMATVLLTLGNFERGWAEHEWRIKAAGSPTDWHTKFPRWTGDDLNGRRILLHSEQGRGDTIQFVRYIPLIAQRGGRVVLGCPPELGRLLRNVSGVKQLIHGAPLPQFDVHCPLPSLPLVFQTTLLTIPSTVPYLTVDPTLSQRWRARLADDRRLKVGLAWAGSPTHGNDRNRSIMLMTLSPLLNIPGIRFFSLQVGAAGEPARRLPASVITDFTNELTDFADTAALVEHLDLIISVDTAVAHLAGALGKAVWVLLPFVPDWRWMLDRDDSPWYPTMRLFRQARLGDWSVPMQRMTRELTRFILAVHDA
jgi:Tetratricopeptide repeat/Glycosyltransferase family 9 (heptosyltransferase)